MSAHGRRSADAGSAPAEGLAAEVANGPSVQGMGEPSAPGRFSLLYESGDGRLCVFEDADGHLSAVDARRLA